MCNSSIHRVSVSTSHRLISYENSKNTQLHELALDFAPFNRAHSQIRRYPVTESDRCRIHKNTRKSVDTLQHQNCSKFPQHKIATQKSDNSPRIPMDSILKGICVFVLHKACLVHLATQGKMAKLPLCNTKCQFCVAEKGPFVLQQAQILPKKEFPQHKGRKLRVKTSNSKIVQNLVLRKNRCSCCVFLWFRQLKQFCVANSCCSLSYVYPSSFL